MKKLIIFIFIFLGFKIVGQPIILRVNYPVLFNENYFGLINGGLGVRIPFEGGASIGIYTDYSLYNSEVYEKINNFNIALEANTVFTPKILDLCVRPYINVGYARITNTSVVDNGLKIDGGLILDHFKKIKYSPLGIHICYRQFLFNENNLGTGKNPGNLLIGLALRLP